ncbi:MAG TPA: chromosome partitioning protein ParA [Actinobacteria bacterium]|jgi:chromosome partitioning protein|nr:chromosome partitioning protein ParA [Actinomycetota bacterium]
MTVVAVLSMKGGVGKTTVALGLASAAWDRGMRTLVIDLDPQANASMALEVTDAVFTTSDVLADARPGVAADAIVHSGWDDRIDVIPAERSLEHRTVVTGRHSALRLRTALATVPRAYDLVVIDCPPSLGELTRNALSTADLAVVVTEPSHFSLHGAREALEAVQVISDATNPGLRAKAIVVNRFDPQDREHLLNLRLLADEHGRLVYDPPLPTCSAIPASQRAVSPLHSWNSPGSRETADIMDDLLDFLLPPKREVRPMPNVSIRRYLT